MPRRNENSGGEQPLIDGQRFFISAALTQSAAPLGAKRLWEAHGKPLHVLLPSALPRALGPRKVCPAEIILVTSLPNS